MLGVAREGDSRSRLQEGTSLVFKIPLEGDGGGKEAEVACCIDSE